MLRSVPVDRCNPSVGLPLSRRQRVGRSRSDWVSTYVGSLPSLLLFLLCCSFFLVAPLRRNASLAGVVERLVDLTRTPQTVKQHGQLASHGNDCSLLGVAPSACGDEQSVLAQIAIGGERTEDVLCRPNQQPAKVRIPFLSDVPLRLTLACIVLSWHQTKPCSDAATTSEPLLVLERQDVRQCGQRSDPGYLREGCRVGISVFGELFDLAVVLADASSELLDHLDQRQQCLTQRFRNAGAGALVKRLGRS